MPENVILVGWNFGSFVNFNWKIIGKMLPKGTIMDGLAESRAKAGLFEIINEPN